METIDKLLLYFYFEYCKETNNCMYFVCTWWVVGSCRGNTSTPQYTGITSMMLWIVGVRGGITTTVPGLWEIIGVNW